MAHLFCRAGRSAQSGADPDFRRRHFQPQRRTEPRLRLLSETPNIDILSLGRVDFEDNLAGSFVGIGPLQAGKFPSEPLQIVRVKLLEFLSRVHLAGDERDGQRLAANLLPSILDRLVACQAQDQPALLTFPLIPEQSGKPRRISLAQLADERVAAILDAQQFRFVRRVGVQHRC